MIIKEQTIRMQKSVLLWFSNIAGTVGQWVYL